MWEYLYKNIFVCWYRCVLYCWYNYWILCFLMLYFYILFWCWRIIVYDWMDINKKKLFFFLRVVFVFYLIKKFIIKIKVVRYLEIFNWKFEIMNWIINVGIWLVIWICFWYILYCFLVERLLVGFVWFGFLI